MHMHSMNLPNFFIIGAPKCGTTSLSEYLRLHPEVFFCKPKEPHYFATDFSHHRYVKNLEDYSSLFSTAASHQAAVGEGSALYLRSDVAVPNILKQIPTARFIVMFRNPVDLAQSMFRQAVFDGWENVSKFEDAWEMQDSRRNGINLPQKCLDHRLLLYKEIASIGSQSKRLLMHAHRDQVLPIFFENFVHHTRDVYTEVCRFLGLSDNIDSINFIPHNKSKRHRIPWLGGVMKKPPHWISQLVGQCKETLGLQQYELLGPLRRINKVAWKQPALRDEFKHDLQNQFSEEIKKLEDVWEVKTGW